MPSFWTRVITLFNVLCGQTSNNVILDQVPIGGQQLASHTTQPTLSSIVPQPTTFDSSGGPDPFRPPSAPSDLKCEYPSLEGYTYCSTDGDRSCWLKPKNESDPSKTRYDINTNYETVFPKGKLRQVGIFTSYTIYCSNLLIDLPRNFGSDHLS